MLQLATPPVGSVDVRRSPSKLTTTQSRVEGQETPFISFWFGGPAPPGLTTDQAAAPAEGLVELATVLPPPTGTHIETLGQEMAKSGAWPTAGS